MSFNQSGDGEHKRTAVFWYLYGWSTILYVGPILKDIERQSHYRVLWLYAWYRCPAERGTLIPKRFVLFGAGFLSRTSQYYTQVILPSIFSSLSLLQDSWSGEGCCIHFPVQSCCHSTADACLDTVHFPKAVPVQLAHNPRGLISRSVWACGY